MTKRNSAIGNLLRLDKLKLIVQERRDMVGETWLKIVTT